jgi:undecaprenyl-diphosphatase
LFSGFRVEQAVTFSFLMAIPLLIGASLLEGMNMLAAPPAEDSILPLLFGMTAACLSGCGAILWLLRALKTGWFSLFGYYCCTIGIITMFAFA